MIKVYSQIFFLPINSVLAWKPNSFECQFVKNILTQLTLMYNLVDPWASSSNLETANEWKGKEKGTFFDNLASYWSAFFCPYLSFIRKGNPLSFSVRNCKNQTENFSYFFTLGLFVPVYCILWENNPRIWAFSGVTMVF